MRVFLSSTSRDLQPERQAVYEALDAAGHDVRRMENFGSQDRDPVSVCLEEVVTYEVCAILLGYRYGELIPELNYSYTGAEYESAREEGVRVHVYVRDGFDKALDSANGADEPLRLRLFRNKLEAAHTVQRPYFTDPEMLSKSVKQDLEKMSNHPRRPWFTRRSGSITSLRAYERATVLHT